ncbi:uncharacterized protein LOC108917400 [Anoplophora glabripennis]|uniref:uncharacterized protein LOC108917400 n=1 Tax=Anoplophora glabripennis TaxID=217634 RepID=UPI0008748A29|nr:uncharacterized protein LOC108917400 [Anoplophora glabripennis]
MNSVEVYDPVKKCHYRILVPQKSKRTEASDDDDEIVFEEAPPKNWNNITIWTQNETLALINIFSLHKDKFRCFKKKKGQWILISEELAKIGINKAPEKCEIKWKNLLRVYRQHKYDNRGPGKFEFFNELDDIIANDPQFRYIIANSNSSSVKIGKLQENSVSDGNKDLITKKKCSCIKSEKQKRHEDRMALMTKKMEIEERKVKAFEDYLKFLKRNAEDV